MKKLLIATAAVFALSSFTVAGVEEVDATSKYITKAKAKQYALKKVSGTVVDIDFDRDDRTPHYEIDIKTKTEKVEVEVNAVTGKTKITDREKLKSATNKKASIITKAKASQIAKSKLNGKGTVTEIELDSDDGVRIYEIELKHGNKEYDVEINAVTGKIIKFKLD